MRHVSMGRIKVIPEISGSLGGGMGARSLSSPNVRHRSLLALPTVIVGDVDEPQGGKGGKGVAGRKSRSPLSSTENAEADNDDVNNANSAENAENAEITDNTDTSASTEDENDGLTMATAKRVGGPGGLEAEASANSEASPNVDASEKNEKEATVVPRPAVAVLKDNRIGDTPQTPIPHTTQTNPSADVNAIKAKSKSKTNKSFSINFDNVNNAKTGANGKRWSFWKRREQEREQMVVASV
jgi:hypothetical protein